jgi:hypothetical protein
MQRTGEDYQALLEKALRLDGGMMSFSDLMARLESGECQCFTWNNSVVITEVLDYPKGRILSIVAVAGDLPDLLKLKERVHEFAKEHGCARARTICRPGFVKLLEQMGWQKQPRVMMQIEV